jgi:predicted 2-oxoglutarate/Fe(II)-dependent dioxygenase YbiX
MTLIYGTPAPLFRAPSEVNPNFSFQSVAGRYVLLAFLPGPGPERDAALSQVRDHLGSFHDDRKLFFGILPDRASFDAVQENPPWRWFLDEAGEVRRLYHATDEAGALVPCWVVLDPSLRVLGGAPLSAGAEVLGHFTRYGLPDDHAGVPLHAPVLIVPRVFEHDFCRRLIDVYEADGGSPSGVMRVRDGRTVGELDDFKRRRDATITDEALRNEIRGRLNLRLAPEIEKAFGWKPTRIERYIVACYSAEDGGYFRPHIDNGAPGTAHRKFACSINLNGDEFEGGDLRFPQFGMRTYRPPTGGAVVFSCSLLHEATPVTRGIRYACLPFLYDEEGARIREANLHTFDDPALQRYRRDEAVPGAAVAQENAP